MLRRTAELMPTTTAVLAGVVAALAIATAAHSREAVAIERFTFDLAGEWEDVWGERRLDINVFEWSADEDRDRIRVTLERRGPEGLYHEVRTSPVVGTVSWPGGLTYMVRYAYRVEHEDGAEDIVLIADRRAWLWWEGGADEEASDNPFTVFQLRFGADGSGEGKTSLAASITADEASGVALEGYEDQPVLLAELRREDAGEA